MLPKQVLKFFSSSLFRRIFSIMMGYGVAQLILLISTPLLTRLYTPEAFGSFGLIFSIAGLFLPLNSLRYEYAMALSHSDYQSRLLIKFCVFLCWGTSLFFLLLFLLCHRYLESVHLNLVQLLLCFMALLFQGFCQIYGVFLITKGETWRLAQGRLVQNIAMVLSQFIFSFISFFSSIGLTIGFIVGVGANFFYYRKVSDILVPQKVKLKMRDIRYLAKKYYRFPVFSSWAGFLDAASTVLPIFFIGPYYGKEVLGVYFLVFRVFTAPTSLVARAVSYVVTKEFSDYRKTQRKIMPLFLKLTGGLLVFAIPYFLCMLWLSYHIYWIFGQRWGETGEVLKILASIIALIGCVSPLTVVFVIINRNGMAALWQVIYVLTTFILMYFSKQLPFIDFLARLVITWIFIYFLYWVMMFIAIKAWDKKLCVE